VNVGIIGVLQSTASVTLLAYLVLAVPQVVLQLLFAYRSALRQRPGGEGPTPPVDLIVPCFNEPPVTLAACLQSLAAQDYSGSLTVWLVDDGSANRDAVREVYARFAHREDFHFVALDRNAGKRHAQAAAISISSGELIIGVDSDTVLDPDAVGALVAAMADPGVGAAMGEVRAANSGDTWLTALVHRRYWLACHQERAAQSYFGAVLCCTGPVSVYRRTALDKVLDDYLGVGDKRRTLGPGEDRDLTGLILRLGCRTIYTPHARARTVVPARLRPYFRQQLRWSRSFYLETARIAPYLYRRHPYLAWDVLAQTIVPFLFAVSTLCTTASTLAGLPPGPWYPASVLAVGALHCGYGATRTKDLRFFLLLGYGLIHIGLTLTVRWYALCTLRTTRWETRG
jgi:N-acetylglucosaminyltransferase